MSNDVVLIQFICEYCGSENYAACTEPDSFDYHCEECGKLYKKLCRIDDDYIVAKVISTVEILMEELCQ